MVEISVIQKSISENTTGEFRLWLSFGEFSISSTEYNRYGEITDYCVVNRITSNKDKAMCIFKKIVENTVSACTLEDVICDLIC